MYSKYKFMIYAAFIIIAILIIFDTYNRYSTIAQQKSEEQKIAEIENRYNNRPDPVNEVPQNPGNYSYGPQNQTDTQYYQPEIQQRTEPQSQSKGYYIESDEFSSLDSEYPTNSLYTYNNMNAGAVNIPGNRVLIFLINNKNVMWKKEISASDNSELSVLKVSADSSTISTELNTSDGVKTLKMDYEGNIKMLPIYENSISSTNPSDKAYSQAGSFSLNNRNYVIVAEQESQGEERYKPTDYYIYRMDNEKLNKQHYLFTKSSSLPLKKLASNISVSVYKDEVIVKTNDSSPIKRRVDSYQLLRTNSRYSDSETLSLLKQLNVKNSETDIRIVPKR